MAASCRSGSSRRTAETLGLTERLRSMELTLKWPLRTSIDLPSELPCLSGAVDGSSTSRAAAGRLCGRGRASNNTKVRPQRLWLSMEMWSTDPFRSSWWAERLKSWTPPWPRLGLLTISKSEAPETLLFNGGPEPSPPKDSNEDSDDVSDLYPASGAGGVLSCF